MIKLLSKKLVPLVISFQGQEMTPHQAFQVLPLICKNR
uniref:Tetratricopeptide repeat-containing family protein n=1 Tax=Rhizophora mucronata TaxID=61149 RepID=A0A2P2J2G3_RHIMU